MQQKRAHLTDDFAYDIMLVATSSKVSGNYIKYVLLTEKWNELTTFVLPVGSTEAVIHLY